MNYHLFQLINAAAGTTDPVDDVFEWCAVWLLYVLGVLAAVPVLRGLLRERVAVVRVAAVLVLAFVVGQGVAAISPEVRPFQTHPVHQLIPHAAGPSLPSDHATAAFALAFAVGAFLSRRWGVGLAVLAVLLGFARVWTGVHYPADILAGAVIAGAAVGAVEAGGRAYDRWADRRRSDAATGH
ncbi:phosphatase PAP2 family protein [Micromonospora soli]|uniref:phosphatase PAP2 family protein n=1 Tax=Micromonospora sp. NBRC 110009 TaxID=3061627 RepID=UPI00267117A5|nr:phosphatase PAP2 family protein [Micromonospora sp. NBRC 110009]WKT97735.1 phosphatase PAP2 family protein [Micromonospora sp. NBRC 110009]